MRVSRESPKLRAAPRSRWIIGAVAVAIGAVLQSDLVPPAIAQSKDAPRAQVRAVPAKPNARQIGLCQCTANRASLQLRCVTTAAACEAFCTSTTYSLLPLSQNALTICPPAEVYVVLPNADGRSGAGAIEVGDGTTVVAVDEAYGAAASLGASADVAAVSLASSESQALFARAIAARPILPRTFKLYFNTGSNQITAAGTAEYRKALTDIKARPIYEVEVIGHTDTVAGDALNQKLSVDRAAAVRQMLIGDGIDERRIAVTGRGKTLLDVRTSDNVAEERNRRVEISVR